jgi:pyruvate dehydrogenase E2 component (dihydrolipoamide acetyltransferase)
MRNSSTMWLASWVATSTNYALRITLSLKRKRENTVPKEVVMPAMEMDQTTGRLLTWLKQEGERVRKGEPLLEIETDKVTVEIESPADGRLAGVQAEEGADVPVGKVIAWILAEGETLPTTSAPSAAAGTNEDAPKLPSATPVAQRVASAHGVDIRAVTAQGPKIMRADVDAYLATQSRAKTKRPRSSPRARRLAAAEGLTLTEISGSGPLGAIVVKDVFAAIQQRAADKPPLQQATVTPDQTGVKREPLSAIRKVIAQRMTSSAAAPHIALTLSVDAGPLHQLLDELEPTMVAQGGRRPSLTTGIVRVLAALLPRHPYLNAHFIDGEIHLFTPVHVGIAVAREQGLIVPVLRHVERKGIAALQAELSELSGRAQDGTLKPDEVRGSTFTLSNLGMFGIESFTAILNPPEVAILSVGAVVDTPVGRNGQIVLRPMMQVTLNADHRVIDGAVAASFLRDFKELAEHPARLLL